MSSSFPLEELNTSSQIIPDIVIREGSIPRGIFTTQVLSEGYIYQDVLYFQSTSDHLLLMIKDVGQIWITDKGEMLVERLPQVTPAEIRFYILGAALGLFLIRRGAFPIHGSTVTNGKYSILFCGPSGAGKSTLSAWFMDQGYKLVADDVSLVHFSDENTPRVWPGIPQVKLWDDSLLALQRDPESLPLLLDNWEKRRLPVDPSSLSGEAPLAAIFLINVDHHCTSPSIRMLTGAERFAAIAGNIYRGETILDMGQGANHFEFSAHLAAQIPVFALNRPNDRFALKEIQEMVEYTLKKLYEASSPN